MERKFSLWDLISSKPDYSLLKKDNEKPLNMKLQWGKFIVVLLLYLAFLYWVKSWWGLLIIPFIYDIYITKKIKWQWWKNSDNSFVRTIMSWVDALVFALVAVYFIASKLVMGRSRAK
jgi:signal peptidase I